MKALFKLLHIGILALFVITGIDIFDKILTSIIAVIAYIFAFSLTRNFSDEVGYDSTLMSLIHWTVRTIASIMMIMVSRLLYHGLLSVFDNTLSVTAKTISIIVCALSWFVIAEVLKRITGLRKNY